jgi:hypothetical protein
VRDQIRFAERYPHTVVAGQFSGRLDNSGERVVLRDGRGQVLSSVAYRPDGFWPIGADGLGYSLVFNDYHASSDDPDAWRASTKLGGSPGAGDQPAIHDRVVVNEVLAHAHPSLEPAIELFNPGPASVGVRGWFLSDSVSQLRKYALPSAVIPPGGFAVVDATEFGTGQYGFALNPGGGTVYLSATDASGELTGAIYGVQFGAAPPGVSFGRHTTSRGPEFVAQTAPTLGLADPQKTARGFRGTGAPNAGPRVGPVVINELMYQPRAGKHEFIELHNHSQLDVPLYHPEDEDQVWALTDGVEFEFPTGVEIAAGGFLLVVGIDPAAFRSRYDVPQDVPVLGPFRGKLDNDGEQIALSRPVLIGGQFVYETVDRISYGPAEPWDPGAAGGGPSLERIAAEEFGNEPRNWLALTAGGTAGRPNTVPLRRYLPTTGVRR